MSLRRTIQTRRALTAAAITTGLVLMVSGCGGGGDGGSSDKTGHKPSAPAGGGQKEEPKGSTADQVLAESRGEDGLVLKITSAERDQGGFVTVQGSVTNQSNKAWVGASWRGDERELAKNGGSLAGASLVDAVGKKKYLVLRDTQGGCLCTKFTGGVLSGQSVDWFAQFPAPPEGTNKVTFQVGAMPPAPIELTEGE